MTRVTIPETGETFHLERPGAVAAWNRALNRRYAMENLVRHESPLVRRIEARRRRRIAALAARRPFDRALDLGAEDGSLAESWRRRGRYTLCLDCDASRLAAGPAGVAADACHLPLASESFDLVVASAILEHVLSPGALLAEAGRVLRPGGRLVAYVPFDDAVCFLKRWARRMGVSLGKLSPDMAPGHLRRFRRRSLRTLFRPHFPAASIRLDLLSLGYYVEAVR